jgi:putative membrane protein
MLEKFRRRNGNTTWRTWLGLVVVPVVVLAGLGLAFWTPMSGNDTAKVAVVNNDEPTTVNGQMAPLGREMAAKLAESTDTGYTWQMTDEPDARGGLTDGTYAAVVTIPKEFSRLAASSLAGKPMDAQRALVQVQASPTSAPADAAATVNNARQSVDRFNRQIIEMYLNGVYGGFSTMHDELGKATDGAGKLADGSGKLAGGLGQFAGGTDGLVDGTGKLNSAAQQLAAGAGQLADGTGRLASGSQQFSGGMNQLEQKTAPLPEMTQKLADGAKQVAAGNRALANVITPLADTIIKAIDAVPTPNSAAASFADLAAHCPVGPVAPFCDQLRAQADRFSHETNAIDDAKARIRQAATDARMAVEGPAFGSEKIAEGNQQLADGMKQLVPGISQAAGGSRMLTGGIVQLDGGAHQLAGGLGQYAGGTGQLAGGTQQLNGGAHQLAGGAGQLADGTKQMANGMAGSGDKIPHYSDADRDHLKTVAASPASLDSSGPGFGKTVIGLLVALALWAGALGTYTMTRAIPKDTVASQLPTWRLALKHSVPGLAVAVASAAALSLMAAPFLALSFASWCGFLGVTALAATSFMAVNQALVVTLGRTGRIVSVAVLVLTVATGVISTVPDFYTGLGSVLPTHGAIQALSSLVTGATGVGAGILELVAWLLVGTVLAAVGIDRHRTLSGKQFRLQMSRPYKKAALADENF